MEDLFSGLFYLGRTEKFSGGKERSFARRSITFTTRSFGLPWPGTRGGILEPERTRASRRREHRARDPGADLRRASSHPRPHGSRWSVVHSLAASRRLALRLAHAVRPRRAWKPHLPHQHHGDAHAEPPRGSPRDPPRHRTGRRRGPPGSGSGDVDGSGGEDDPRRGPRKLPHPTSEFVVLGRLQRLFFFSFFD